MPGLVLRAARKGGESALATTCLPSDRSRSAVQRCSAGCGRSCNDVERSRRSGPLPKSDTLSHAGAVGTNTRAGVKAGVVQPSAGVALIAHSRPATARAAQRALERFREGVTQRCPPRAGTRVQAPIGQRGRRDPVSSHRRNPHSPGFHACLPHRRSNVLPRWKPLTLTCGEQPGSRRHIIGEKSKGLPPPDPIPTLQ